MPHSGVGRVEKFRTAFVPSTFASAVARGTLARPGNAAKIAGVCSTGLIVQGMSGSFWLIRVNATLPLITVRGWSLYIAVALNELNRLSGGTAMRPIDEPFPLL